MKILQNISRCRKSFPTAFVFYNSLKTPVAAHLFSINGQASDSNGDLLPSLTGVEKTQGGLGGDAHTAGMREAQLLWYNHLA